MKIKVPKLGYFIKLTFQGIFRNGVMSFASMLVLMSCLIATGTAWLLSINIDSNLEDINNYNKIVVYVKEDADDDAIESIRNALNSISGITDITYVSKEDALKDMTEKYGDIDAYIQMFGDTNFFKPSFRITYAQASEADNIVYLIQQIPNIDKINSRQDIAKKIEELKSAVSLIFTWLVLLLFIVSIFVIINTVKASVFARKDEIAIMRYVGASRFFIGFPFFSQGIVIGAISAGIAYFMQSYLYEYFAQGTLGGYSIINIIPFNTVNIKILIAFLVIGIVTGVTGSVISLRRYTKV